mgnify:CR=1 FL=1
MFILQTDIWEKKRTYIRKNIRHGVDKQVEEEIGKLTATMLTKLTEVLSGAKNAGKFFHTVDVFDPALATNQTSGR